MNFQDITIVNIDGRPGQALGGQCAIRASQQQLPGARGLLLTPERPRPLLDGIEHQPIQPLGYLDYGLFVMYALHALIPTEFALIVQDDGWVLNGDQWSPEFFNHDLIGAPIHLARVVMHTGQSAVFKHFKWLEHLGQPDRRVDIVLNGGFTLRSKRLLKAPSALGLPFVLPPATGLQGPRWTMVWDGDPQLEDVHLCLHMRQALLGAGIRFAPLELARRFAFEHLCPPLHDGLDLARVLGHHSALRKLVSLEPPTVRYLSPLHELQHSHHDEHRVVALLHSRGYRVEFP
jgi:hypothetical protein